MNLLEFGCVEAEKRWWTVLVCGLWFVFLHRKIRLTQLWDELSWVVAIKNTYHHLIYIHRFEIQYHPISDSQWEGEGELFNSFKFILWGFQTPMRRSDAKILIIIDFMVTLFYQIKTLLYFHGDNLTGKIHLSLRFTIYWYFIFNIESTQYSLLWVDSKLQFKKIHLSFWGAKRRANSQHLKSWDKA